MLHNSTFSEVILPNQTKILCLHKDEVPIIYEQVQEYFRNGIVLNEGSTVFDVGANIGLFSIWVYELCNKDINVYAFEPIPQVFQVLAANANRFDPQKLKVFPFGLSQQSKTQTFSYYPNATPLSTAYPDTLEEGRDKFKKAALQKIAIVRKNNDLFSPFYWYSWLPRFLLLYMIDRTLDKAFQIEQVTCQLKALSEIISEYNVQQIDLLKIDVEKSELDVLLGIKEQDWSKIQQVVVEVHNLERRVDKVTALLKSQGFSKIMVEQEPVLAGSDIFNIYALRR